MTEAPAERKLNTEWTNEIGPLRELADLVGAGQAAKPLGLSDIIAMLRDSKARPAYVMAADFILARDFRKSDGLLVLKCSATQKQAIMTLVDAMGVQYVDLDL